MATRSRASRRGRSGRARRAPASVRGRDTRVESLRGLVLVAMFVAHCAPSPGPLRLFNLTEFATAPLFALLIGIGAELGDRGSRGLPAAFVRAGILAAVLVALGLWLETWGAQVDIVLLYLALPTLLAPLLARLPVTALAGVATALWASAPYFMESFGSKAAEAAVRGDQVGARLWNVVFTGTHYRLTTLLVFTCIGIILWRAMSSVRLNWHIAAAGAFSLLLAAGLMLAKEAGRIDFEPYSGTHLEVAFCALLVVGISGVWLGLAPDHVDIPLLSVAGAMTLSVYVVQIGYLAWYVRSYAPGRPDDSWANVAILTALGVVLPLLWRSAVPREPLTKGPIEGPTAVLTRIFR